MSWRATLERSWTHDGSTLHVMESRADGLVNYLCSDGTWKTVDANTAFAPEGAGIFLPWGAAEAIIAALAPEATAGELGALREALKIERTRVDIILMNRGQQ